MDCTLHVSYAATALNIDIFPLSFAAKTLRRCLLQRMSSNDIAASTQDFGVVLLVPAIDVRRVAGITPFIHAAWNVFTLLTQTDFMIAEGVATVLVDDIILFIIRVNCA